MKEKKIKYRRDREACLIEAAVEALVLLKKGAKVRQKLNSDQEEIFRLLQVARSDCKQHNWKKLLLVLNSIGKRLLPIFLKKKRCSVSDHTVVLTVVLDKDYRVDDAEGIISAIRMVKGVLSVDANVADDRESKAN